MEHSHKNVGIEVSRHHGVAGAVLDRLKRDDAPIPGRVFALDLDRYHCNKKAARKYAEGGPVGRKALQAPADGAR